MRNIFQTLAMYNRSVNQHVMDLLGGLSRDQVMTDMKAFFHSLFETFMHNLNTDLIWLRRFEGIYPNIKCLRGNAFLALDDGQIRKNAESDFRNIFEIRKRLDALIEEFIHEINDRDFIRAIQYKNIRGEQMEKLLWQVLLHWFLHQTHHRGNISVMLDMIGVNNDFSSLISRV
ncbi:MAG TPA: DinB family protein [Spirochaetota bacterium]|nr:DinB family protein [Spirochaetota bacterium]HPC39699.1 DinB family protein [Spirochaetota bacterium]HPL19222.1 DinB family protein [Spirochaetota bacterium]HQF07427.1 DinB family protein [Spirochaetota bacterium]HQH96687.1 DinB family protein [Spirochaetota bacterium]